MKSFSRCELTKGLVVLFTLGVLLILYSAIPDYYQNRVMFGGEIELQISFPNHYYSNNIVLDSWYKV